MLDLIRKHKIQVFDHGTQYSETSGYSVGAVGSLADIKKLKQAGYHVAQHEDVDKLGKARQKEVGRGDRYKEGGPADLSGRKRKKES